MLSKPKAPTAQYKEIRGLSRGLEVLRALNCAPGGVAATTELAHACGMHRTTIKRILETLRKSGIVRQGEREGQYYLTFEVRRLSEGFEDEAWVEQIASPLMQASVRELLWPCDLGTLEAGFMVVRESTHRWSMFSQHRAMIGERLPLLVTAMGRAYFAASNEAERAALIEFLSLRPDQSGELARDKRYVARVLRETQKRGYGLNEGEWSPQADFGAIAVPVFSKEHLFAAINMVYPKSAVKPGDLASKYLPALRKLAAAIGKESVGLVKT